MDGRKKRADETKNENTADEASDSQVARSKLVVLCDGSEKEKEKKAINTANVIKEDTFESM